MTRDDIKEETVIQYHEKPERVLANTHIVIQTDIKRMSSESRQRHEEQAAKGQGTELGCIRHHD